MKPYRPPLITDSLPNAPRIPFDVITSIVKHPLYGSPQIVDDELFYDAPDHFSDDEFDDDIDEEQAPDDDVDEMVIKFKPFTVWNNSEHNEVEYILPPHFGE